MKKISLLLAFIAFFATASFAKAFSLHTIAAQNDQNFVKAHYVTNGEIKNPDQDLLRKSCTVSVTYTGTGGQVIHLTVTSTCDCSQQDACNAAYAVVSVIIPN